MAEFIKKITEEVFQRLRKRFRIRKLSTYECFVLMGMTREDVDKAKNMGVSDSQLYKIAGNGLVTNCIQYLGEHLYKATIDKNFITTDERMAELYGEIK